MLASTVAVIGVTLVLPYLPLNSLLGFVECQAPLMLALMGLAAIYVFVVQAAKEHF